MPSIVTSVIGGFQSASAAHHAADKLSAGYDAAGNLIKDATASAQDYGRQGITAVNEGVNSGNAAIQTGLGSANTAVNTGRDNANQTLADVYGTAQKNLQPYQDLGAQGSAQLAKGLADGGDLSQKFDVSMMESQDPGYQFRLEQGQKALARSAAAAGGSLGGGAMKSLARYSQGQASSEYGAAFDRFTKQQQQRYTMLSGAAGLGLNATGMGIAAGNAYGAGVSANDMNAGRELSANGMNAGNATSGNFMTGAGRVQQGNEYLGSVGMQGAQQQGQMIVGSRQAQAQGDLSAANAWNGMLSGIGQGANSILMGGFGGGGGFSLSGAASGIPNYGGGGGGWGGSPFTPILMGGFGGGGGFSLSGAASGIPNYGGGGGGWGGSPFTLDRTMATSEGGYGGWGAAPAGTGGQY